MGDGYSWRGCSTETGCCVTLRTLGSANARDESTNMCLTEEEVKGEPGEEFEEDDGGDYVLEEEAVSEGDEVLEYGEEDEERDEEMQDIDSDADKESSLYCEDYLTLVRNLIPDEMKQPRPEIFYPINLEAGDTFESSLWEREKGNYGVDEEVQLVGVEHIAGPNCFDDRGYNGHNISAAEMKGCTTYQCLAYKMSSWTPDSDDQEWENDSECFLTGIGDRFPSRDMAHPQVYPPRHGWDKRDADTFHFVSISPHPLQSPLLSSANENKRGRTRRTSRCPSTQPVSTSSSVSPSKSSGKSIFTG